MRYYIADLHFFHEALNYKMDKRNFPSVEAMHEYMIEKWNGKVKKKDEVVILGDFSLGRGKETNEILRALNGKKYLIMGNHDRYLNDKEFDESLFGWATHYRELSDNGRKVVLCHYPIICYNGQYKLSKSGDSMTYMLYGHVHDTHDEKLLESFRAITRSTEVMLKDADGMHTIPCNMLNCFCKYSDYEPLSLDEWIELHNGRQNEVF